MNLAEIKRMLQQHYNIYSEDIPLQKEAYDWKSENNFGFLMGMIAYGRENHNSQLHSLLHHKQFKDQERSFIDSMFDYYIRPFHRNFTIESDTHNTISSRSSSNEDCDSLPEGKELSYKDFEKAVVKRDGFCLFCWESRSLKVSHIIAQNNTPIPDDEASIFKEAGLTQKHQVQNGLLLCLNCYGQFQKLKRYMDVVDDKLVAKLINDTNDINSEKHKIWNSIVRVLKGIRKFRQEHWTNIDDRQAVETNGEMALYFLKDEPTNMPSRNALEFHKTACLIWRMAGGLEADEDCCSDDGGPVNTAALRKRFNIPAQDSSINTVTSLNQVS